MKFERYLMNESLRKPKGVGNIYDNEGETFDRYTIMLKGRGWNVGDAIVASDDTGPRGVLQLADGVKEGKNLGRKIKWESLPDNVKDAVTERLESE